MLKIIKCFKGSSAIWAEAVSYTHLDVYKRQLLNIWFCFGIPLTLVQLDNTNIKINILPSTLSKTSNHILFVFTVRYLLINPMRNDAGVWGRL